MTTRPLQKRMKRCMTSVSFLCDRRKRSRPDHEQTTTMYHDTKMGLVNNDREQKKKKNESERKTMQDEDLSVEWRWVAASSSEEGEEKSEEAWEREQMKHHDFDLGDACNYKNNSWNSVTGSRREASEDEMKMTQNKTRRQCIKLGREARIQQHDGPCPKPWFR